MESHKCRGWATTGNHGNQKRQGARQVLMSGWHGPMIGHGWSQEVHCLGFTTRIHNTLYKTHNTTHGPCLLLQVAAPEAGLFPSPTAILASRLAARHLRRAVAACPLQQSYLTRESQIQALQGPNALETMHPKAAKTKNKQPQTCKG